MKDKFLLSIGLSTVLSGVFGILINNKENKYNKHINIISTLLITIGSALSASALDDILKPEEDEEIENE